MFSPAYWMHYESWAYAFDEYGERIRLNSDAWGMAWLFTYAGDLSGSANRAYPADKDI